MDELKKGQRGRGFPGFMTVVMLSVLVGSLTAAAQDPGKPKKTFGLSLKLSGVCGYALNGGGDIDAFRKSLQEVVSTVSAHEGYTSTFDWPRPWFLPGVTADLIIHVGPHLGFGLGTGFLSASSAGSYAITYRDSWSYESISAATDEKMDQALKHRMTAIPVKASLYVFQPLGAARRLTLFARGGVGYYYGKMTLDYPSHDTYAHSFGYGSYTSKYSSEYQRDITGVAKCNSWGWDGGLGLEFRISRAISLGAELYGRSVNFKNWEGDLSTSWQGAYRSESTYSSAREYTRTGSAKVHGFLWTYQVHDSDTNRDYTSMMIFKEQPEGEYLRNVRKSTVGLNALSIAISARFHFDLF